MRHPRRRVDGGWPIGMVSNGSPVGITANSEANVNQRLLSQLQQYPAFAHQRVTVPKDPGKYYSETSPLSEPFPHTINTKHRPLQHYDLSNGAEAFSRR